MVSLEEAIENKSPNLQNVAPVYRRIILSIEEINWLDKIYYDLRYGFKAEGSIFDFSGSLLPGKGSKSTTILFSFLIENNEIKNLECSNNIVKNIITNTIQDCLGYSDFKPIKDVKIGGVYRHYDGEEFIVESISRHTDHDEKLVNYQKIGEEEIWSRPIETFTDGRFQLVD